MRAHHAIAVVAIMLVGFGVKMFVFSTPSAEADMRTVKNSSMNILQMQQG